MKPTKGFAAAVAALLMAGLLAACGGGGGEPATVAVPTRTPVSAASSATGVLSDAAVGGVSYSTSSGVFGVTADDGAYQFNPGDTVTFKLGAVTLGTVTATGIITPMELSGGSAAKLQNLLVLLQSLDADGDPGNGIAIPAAAAAALAASVDLNATTATFASAANTGLRTAMAAGGITGAIKTTAEANAHFKSQAVPLLSSNIWVNQSVDRSGQTYTVVLRVDPEGRYLQVDAGATWYDPLSPSPLTVSGLELGVLSATGFTPAGFSITATVTLDTNSEMGPSGRAQCNHFRIIGDKLIDTNCRSVQKFFDKMPNDQAGLTGAYLLAGLAITEFYFLPNGTFVLAEYPTQYCSEDCDPLIQYGSYTFSNGALVLKTQGNEPLTFQLELVQKGFGFNLSGNGMAGYFTRISN